MAENHGSGSRPDKDMQNKNASKQTGQQSGGQSGTQSGAQKGSQSGGQAGSHAGTQSGAQTGAGAPPRTNKDDLGNRQHGQAPKDQRDNKTSQKRDDDQEDEIE